MGYNQHSNVLSVLSLLSKFESFKLVTGIECSGIKVENNSRHFSKNVLDHIVCNAADRMV